MSAGAWSTDEDSTLRRAILRGDSSGQALVLFAGRSRNALIGRAHRLGLQFGIGRPVGPSKRLTNTHPKPGPKPSRPSAAVYRVVPARHPERAGKPSTIGQAALKRVEEAKPTSATNVPFLDRAFDQCVFMFGRGMNAMVCGARVHAEGEPYCGHHHKVTHVEYTPGLRKAQAAPVAAKPEPDEDEFEADNEVKAVDEFEGEVEDELEPA